LTDPLADPTVRAREMKLALAAIPMSARRCVIDGFEFDRVDDGWRQRRP